MTKTHNFYFEGGEILSKISASWFVAYAYYIYVDSSFRAWDCKITTLNFRMSKFVCSKRYHNIWLEQVLKMEQLDKNLNSVGLNSCEIKFLANEILKKIS
ncbi:MAG: hypothetical protein WCR30_01790 [Clostridia bacterium]